MPCLKLFMVQPPRMIDEGRGQYADPSSLIRAGAMLLEHIGYQQKADKLTMALEICQQYERKITIRVVIMVQPDVNSVIILWKQFRTRSCKKNTIIT